LILDELYHASGVLASKLVDNVVYFKHNNSYDLEQLLKKYYDRNIIVAIEGIYSMSGDVAEKRIFELSDKYGFILIVDEAHSSGVIGDNLLGIFDYYQIKPNHNHIKMGTLGKAYGSYGAYILASSTIINFLQNRAKPIIYSTAPSIFDTLLAHNSLKYIQKNSKKLHAKIAKRQKLAKSYFKSIDGLILDIKIKSNQEVIKIRDRLISEGYIVGAIRQPTVDTPILRVILRINVSLDSIEKLLAKLYNVSIKKH